MFLIISFPPQPTLLFCPPTLWEQAVCHSLVINAVWSEVWFSWSKLTNLWEVEAAFTSRYVAIFLTPMYGYRVTSQVKVGGQAKMCSGFSFSFLRADLKKWALRLPLFSGPFPPTTWGQTERSLLGETRGSRRAGAPWGLAHSHGRSPRFTLKWEKHRSGPRGVAQAPASFAGSGLTVRPHQPACRNLLCTFKSCWCFKINLWKVFLICTYKLWDYAK